jgi:hypothetical protein
MGCLPRWMTDCFKGSVLGLLSLMSLTHGLIVCGYLFYSYFFATNKPIFDVDIYLFPITSSIIHYVKIDRGDHHNLSFWIATLFSVLTIVVLSLVRARTGLRPEGVVYDDDIGVPVGYQLTYKRIIASGAEPITSWYQTREHALNVSLAMECASFLASVMIFVFTDGKKKRENTNNKVKPASGFWEFMGRLSPFYIWRHKKEVKGFCLDRKSDTRDKTTARLVIVSIKFFLLHSILCTLIPRLLLSLTSLYYDLPYLTEQETPSGIYYCAMWLYFGHMIIRGKRVKQYESPSTAVEPTPPTSKGNNKKATVKHVQERFTRERPWCRGFLILVMLIISALTLTGGLMADRSLLASKDIPFGSLAKYNIILRNDDDLGGFKYMVPSVSETLAPPVFGRMTYVSHIVLVLEHIQLYMLIVLTAIWIFYYQQKDENIFADDAKQIMGT